MIKQMDKEQFDPVSICSEHGGRVIRARLGRRTRELMVVPEHDQPMAQAIRAGEFHVIYHW